MNDFTFLTNEQIFGSKLIGTNLYGHKLFGHKQLEILKKYGKCAAITDFSILLGGYVSPSGFASEGNALKDRAGFWWTKSKVNIMDKYSDCVSCVFGNDIYFYPVLDCAAGARPALAYSSIKSISSNEVVNFIGIKEIEYGEYPQTVVEEDYSNELEKAYNNGSIRYTGKKYTTDSERFDNDKGFSPRTHVEYEYKGNKYIRFVGDKTGEGEVLSDGRKIASDNIYWVRVEPIVWLVDEKADIALSKKIIFSGVQFLNMKQGHYTGDFDNTNIKNFMNIYFSKDIVSSRVDLKNTSAEQLESYEEPKLIRKQNPYEFNFNEVSEEEIIRGAVESNVAVFLHGKSSDGKSARVKQLDPDCEIIYMRNATPDSLNGKSVYNSTTGEMIDVPPTWYSKVKAKCEAEPDKIHIIFFDELTNALPSIQGMAFNIVLDGEVNGKWKLPPNARIVAAGNDLNDSLAANQMAEPLFNRFAHVYINTTVDNWLKWASTPKEKYERLDYKDEELEAKIHPSVYAYIAYKSYSGHDVLRTPYTGDKPNADPRKWEMASKILYKTKQPEMLRALIGEDLAKDFTAFARQQVISVEDVINHNYSSNDLEMDISEKFATAVGLSSVDDEHFEIVRDFMKQVGAEPRAAFESMWSHGDERRLEHLAEVQMADNLSQGEIRR